MALAFAARAAMALLLALAMTMTATAAPAPEEKPAASGPMTLPPDAPRAPPDTLPDDSSEDEPVDDQPAEAPSGLPTAIPVVEYDVSKLPGPVRMTRQAIIDAASTGDPEQLRAVIRKNGSVPDLGPEDLDDPIEYLVQQSGDEEGREILAILIEVLDAGFVHADAGTPDEAFIWPYFARYPVDQLSPSQMVELFKLVYAGDYQDMLAYGLYTSFRVGIAPDGTWTYFLTD